jgi:hypothetical protein
VKRALGTFAQIGRGQRYVVLSSSPDGRTPGLVGLPLDGQVETFDARDAFLYDGEAPARARARKEQKRIRAVLGAYAGLSGLVCLLLFAAHLRQAARTLDADLKRVGLSSAARDSGLGLPLLALFSLFFAFSLAVLWIVAR